MFLSTVGIVDANSYICAHSIDLSYVCIYKREICNKLFLSL